MLSGAIVRPNYLNVIKEIFFYTPEYIINSLLKEKKFSSYIYSNEIVYKKIMIKGEVISVPVTKPRNKKLEFKYNNIVMSSPISITISSITLVILLFILMSEH